MRTVRNLSSFWTSQSLRGIVGRGELVTAGELSKTSEGLVLNELNYEDRESRCFFRADRRDRKVLASSEIVKTCMKCRHKED